LSDEEFANKFDEIQMALNDKIENTICFAKNLDADIEQFKAEEQRIAERRKAKEKLSERLKSNIDRYIRHQFTDENGNVDELGLNKFKMETPRMKISYRKSTKVDVTDESQVPKQFIKEEVVTKIDKKELKEYLKKNNCNGAKIVTNISMSIK
jgi:Siphovirus Gp157.